MKKYFKILLASASFAIATSVSADLVWNAERGWNIEGGALAPILGEGINVENALHGMNVAQKAMEEGDYSTALNVYLLITGDYPDSIFAPEAFYQMGIAYTKKHMFTDANEAFSTIIKRYHNYPRYNQVIAAKFNIAYAVQNGEIPYLWGWLPWFRDETEAISIYESVVKNSPYSEYAQMALMNISVLAERNDKTELAIDALDRLISTYPQSIFLPDAYLQLAKTYRNTVEGAAYDQANTKHAISFYSDYLTLFPDGGEIEHVEAGIDVMYDTLARSRLVMGDFFYYYRNDAKAAAIFYNETITTAPKTLAADQAREQLKLLAEGVDAPMTPVDWFFGRYERPTIEAFEDETRVDSLHTEVFRAIQAEDMLFGESMIYSMGGYLIDPMHAGAVFMPLAPIIEPRGFVE
ncbi:MAG: tetratricopeptide repeat protein [Opitutales bacterium]